MALRIRETDPRRFLAAERRRFNDRRLLLRRRRRPLEEQERRRRSGEPAWPTAVPPLHLQFAQE